MTAAHITDPTRHTISQIARLAGVSVSRARRYATLHLIRPCTVTAGGYQFFDDASVQRVRFLRVATEAGMPLAEVARLLANLDRGEAEQIQVVRGRLHRLVEERRTTLTHFSVLLERLCTADGFSPDGVPPKSQDSPS